MCKLAFSLVRTQIRKSNNKKPPQRVAFYYLVGLTRLASPLRYICLTAPAYFRPPDVPRRTAFSLVQIQIRQSNNKKPPFIGGFLLFGRIDQIRTSDLFDPNEAFYQAELHSVYFRVIVLTHFFYNTSKIFKNLPVLLNNFTTPFIAFYIPIRNRI